MAKLKLIEFDLCVWLYKGDPSFAVVNQRMRETGCKWMARLKVSVHFDQLKLLDQVLFYSSRHTDSRERISIFTEVFK